LSPLPIAQQRAQEPSIVQRRIPGVELEEWGVAAKCSGEVLSYPFSLTMFGNLEVFFVSLSLLSYGFVILIKYSRGQKEKRSIIPPLSSLFVARELNSYLSD